MKNTVKGIIIIFVYDQNIRTYPERRIYYTKRSQPPLIVPVMHSYVEAMNDKQFLAKHIDLLEIEVTYWITNHIVGVVKYKKPYTLPNTIIIQGSYHKITCIRDR
ncbi:trehalase-like [Rhopalosiphum maidis]|uniref:trehalase-like n=1 Tax=Rhopalosiphum maidis TaxID=43146 RepID=UPI000EFFF1EC|nr:trehalase-like [Rhopalosiphum maidis]